jgi:hypothetical protein
MGVRTAVQRRSLVAPDTSGRTKIRAALTRKMVAAVIGGTRFLTTILGASAQKSYIQFGVCHLRIVQDMMTRAAQKPSAVIKKLDK